jgi:hypothetical protein
MDIRFGSFIWNGHKELLNLAKHGVGFEEAVLAFKDPRRKIHVDLKHSSREERFFCVGRVGERILTVRFAYHGGLIRIIGAGHWRKWRKYYREEEKKSG